MAITLMSRGTLPRGRLAHQPTPPVKPDFEKLVGTAGWRRLAPAIRQRFTEHPLPDRPIPYIGIMQRVDCSGIGFLLAQASRLLGTPFAPFRGTDVPVAITLRSNPGDGAVVWERDYRYADHPAVLVRSVKRNGPDGSLLECGRFGFTMQLEVFEAGGTLNFRSLRYLWRIGRWHIPLPHLLSPGTAHVIHEDLPGDRFRFSMTIRHPWFGLLFDQDGIFQRGE